MTSLQLVILILFVVAILAASLWHWYRSDVFKRAGRLARRVFPVWAAQGPFDSGEESAAAMRYAYLAVFGPEEAERMGMVQAIAEHAAAYDSNPAAWEKNRQEAVLSASSETDKFVTIAKSLAEMDPPKNETHQTIHEPTEDTLPWSSNPGAYEAHLIRRYNNPYFPESRRNVSREDLLIPA